jgi:hypothetical protein
VIVEVADPPGVAMAVVADAAKLNVDSFTVTLPVPVPG